MSSTMYMTDGISEDDIIREASGGSLKAFNQLVLQHQDMAFNHAWSILGDRETAADVTQESFIKAYLAIDRFRGGSFRAWLLRIVTNTAYDFIRKSNRQPVQTLFPENEVGEENDSPHWITDRSPSVESIVAHNEGVAQIYQILNELPDIYRTVLTLIDIYDFKYKETAHILGVKVGTIKSRLLRARLQMRNKLMGNPNYHLLEDLKEKSQFKPDKKNKNAQTDMFNLDHKITPAVCNC